MDRTDEAGLRQRIEELISRIESYVPYVLATISRHNGVDIPDRPDWMGIHRGRAQSSFNQLKALEQDAKSLRAALAVGPLPEEPTGDLWGPAREAVIRVRHVLSSDRPTKAQIQIGEFARLALMALTEDKNAERGAYYIRKAVQAAKEVGLLTLPLDLGRAFDDAWATVEGLIPTPEVHEKK